MVKKKNKIAIIVVITIVMVLVVLLIFEAKKYYEQRYVIANVYYTQIPLDESNENTGLYNAEGERMQDGKEYLLIGYDENGQQEELSFSVVGTEQYYYPAGTYLRVNMSKMLVLGESSIARNEIPALAMEKIESEGTKVE